MRVHNEIHNMQKPSEALRSQVFQVVAISSQIAKGWQRAHFASRQDHSTSEAQRARHPRELAITNSYLPREFEVRNVIVCIIC